MTLWPYSLWATGFNDVLANVAAHQDNLAEITSVLAAIAVGEHAGAMLQVDDIVSIRVLEEWAAGFMTVDPDVLGMLAEDH